MFVVFIRFVMGFMGLGFFGCQRQDDCVVKKGFGWGGVLMGSLQGVLSP